MKILPLFLLLPYLAGAAPNVLFIAADDLRNDLGCYGHPEVKTPHLDALAGRGITFDRAYCQQAVCNPSRASLLTGLRPDTLKIWDLPTHFRQTRPNIITLPQAFKQHGYFTQNIGKIFHNWRQDAYKGDPQSWSVPAVMHYNSHGNDKALTNKNQPKNSATAPRCENLDVPDDAYFDGRIANLAVEALQERAKEPDQPFFLAVGFWKPHLPFNPPRKYWDLYQRSQISLPSHPDRPENAPDIAFHDGRELIRATKKRQVDGRRDSRASPWLPGRRQLPGRAGWQTARCAWKPGFGRKYRRRILERPRLSPGRKLAVVQNFQL